MKQEESAADPDGMFKTQFGEIMCDMGELIERINKLSDVFEKSTFCDDKEINLMLTLSTVNLSRIFQDWLTVHCSLVTKSQKGQLEG